MQSSGTQASPHISTLEDKQIIQLVIDNETNGREFEFAEEILAKEIIIKGFSFYSTNTSAVQHRDARGGVDLRIEWLKVNHVRLDQSYSPVRGTSLFLPWDFRAQGSQSTTYDYGMNLPISLPSQTALRKRFKATVGYFNVVSSEYVMPNEAFRLVLLIEVVHDHIFR